MIIMFIFYQIVKKNLVTQNKYLQLNELFFIYKGQRSDANVFVW